MNSDFGCLAGLALLLATFVLAPAGAALIMSYRDEVEARAWAAGCAAACKDGVAQVTADTCTCVGGNP